MPLDLAGYDPNLIDVPPGTPSAAPAPAAAPAAAGGDDNWLSRIGMVLSSTAAGLQGDPYYAQRVMQGRQQMELQKKQQAADDEKLEFSRQEAMRHTLDSMGKYADLIGGDEDKAGKIAKFLLPTLNRASGGTFNEDDLKQILMKPDDIELLVSQYEEIQKTGGIDQATRRLMKEGKLSLKDILAQRRQQLDDRVFQALIQHPDKNIKLGDFAESKWLSEDHKNQLNVDYGFKNIKSKAATEKQITDEPVQARFEQNQARQSQEFADREQRMEANQARLAGQFNASQNVANARLAQSDERLRLQEEQQKRLLPSQQKVLTGDRTAMAAIDDYKQGYEKFIAESKGGPLSDIFRGTIAKNKTAQKIDDVVMAKGRTPAEIELAAKYNALIGNLRSLTNEVGVLTDVDAVRILGSFDPAQGRQQVLANINARRKTHERSYSTALEDYQSMGKDVSKYPPATGKAQAGKKAADPLGIR